MGLNETNSSGIDESYLWYYEHQPQFWLLISISILIAFAGVIGNTMVIYAATQKRHISVRFCYNLDIIIVI